MKNKEDIKYIEKLKKLVGKQIKFKLTNDTDDDGLVGILKQFKDNLIIEHDGVELVVELHELYYIDEFIN